MKRAIFGPMIAIAWCALFLTGASAGRSQAASPPDGLKDLLRRLPDNARIVFEADASDDNPNMQFVKPAPPSDDAERRNWEAVQTMRKSFKEGLSRILLLFGFNADLSEPLSKVLGPQFVVAAIPGAKSGPPNLLFLASVKDSKEAEKRIGGIIGVLARNAVETDETIGEGTVHTWSGFPFADKIGKGKLSFSYLIGEKFAALGTSAEMLKAAAAPAKADVSPWLLALASAQPRSLMSLYVSPHVTDLFGSMAKDVPDLEKQGFVGEVSSLFLSEDGLTLQGTTLVGKEGALPMAVAAAAQAPSLTDAAFAHVPANSLAALGISSPAGWLKTLGGMGVMGEMSDASNPMAPVIQIFSSALDGDVAVSLRSLLPLPSVLVTVASADADAAAKKLSGLQGFAQMAKAESSPATGRDGEALTAFKADLGPYHEILLGSQGSYLVGSTDRQTLMEANRLVTDPGGSLAESDLFKMVRKHVGDHPRVMLFVDLRALSGAGMILLQSFMPGPIGAEAARSLKAVQGAGVGIEVSADRIDKRVFLSGDPAQVLPAFAGGAVGAGIAASAILIPRMQQAKGSAQRAACQANLKQLGKAAMLYAQDYDEHLPKADKWTTQLKPYLNGSGMLHCPSDNQPGTSYAMNSKLSGLALSQVTDPAHTVLFYESDLHGDDPSGTGQGMTMRHNGGLSVVYADGHAEILNRALSLDDFKAVRGPNAGGIGSSKPKPPAKRENPPVKRKSPAAKKAK